MITACLNRKCCYRKRNVTDISQLADFRIANRPPRILARTLRIILPVLYLKMATDNTVNAQLITCWQLYDSAIYVEGRRWQMLVLIYIPRDTACQRRQFCWRTCFRQRRLPHYGQQADCGMVDLPWFGNVRARQTGYPHDETRHSTCVWRHGASCLTLKRRNKKT